MQSGILLPHIYSAEFLPFYYFKKNLNKYLAACHISGFGDRIFVLFKEMNSMKAKNILL